MPNKAVFGCPVCTFLLIDNQWVASHLRVRARPEHHPAFACWARTKTRSRSHQPKAKAPSSPTIHECNVLELLARPVSPKARANTRMAQVWSRTGRGRCLLPFHCIQLHSIQFSSARLSSANPMPSPTRSLAHSPSAAIPSRVHFLPHGTPRAEPGPKSSPASESILQGRDGSSFSLAPQRPLLSYLWSLLSVRLMF
ncbi:hypothetical protein BD289DRAFT_436796, partial [Coniella lustricola]